MRWTVWRFAAPARWYSKARQRTAGRWFRWAGAFWSRIPTICYVIEICNTLPENSGLYVRGLTCTDYSVGKRLNAPEEQLEAMRAVLEAVRSQNAGKYLSELNVSDANRLWMVSRTGIRVELGDSAQMEDKLRWACSAIADLENRGETLGTLDVSSAMRADFMPQS